MEIHVCTKVFQKFNLQYPSTFVIAEVILDVSLAGAALRMLLAGVTLAVVSIDVLLCALLEGITN